MSFLFVYILLSFIALAICLIKIRAGHTVPLIVSVLTLFFWYGGDILYNGMDLYSQEGINQYSEASLVQVCVFLVTVVTSVFLTSMVRQGSRLSLLERFSSGDCNSFIESELQLIRRLVKVIALSLFPFLLIRYGGDLHKFFFPYIFGHPGPWLTTGIGGGFNSLLALITNLHIALASVVGVWFVMDRSKVGRRKALLLILALWPIFIFDRTRGYILLIVLPSAIIWFYMNLHRNPWSTIVKAVLVFVILEFWFSIIIEARGLGFRVVDYVVSGDFIFNRPSFKSHQGLNMFEELVWINSLIANGGLEVLWGWDYFSNLVNIVPRSFWPDKPTIGIEYALARGLADPYNPAGVIATLSHGIVGQGVLNFGTLFGPIVGGLLFAFWVGFAGKYNTVRYKPGNMILFLMAVSSIFNLGRDLSILNIYPFVFSLIVIYLLNKFKRNNL